MRVRRRLRRLKRLALLGAAMGTIIAVRRAKARRDAQPRVGPPATWPPLEVGEPPVAAVGDLAAVLRDRPDRSAAPAGLEELNGDQAWVAPVDGACPVSHPVKVNASSGIYHMPGGRFYDRTRPERCYSDPAAAEADGYRAAKGP
jgi:hypothetical protein